ncbi:MAG: radical SAM protein [Flavobacteriales bacterium]|nr:radical SAM protein [Flavobacteriales bacterium]
MRLPEKAKAEYAASRSGTYRPIICHAPFVSLNFEQNGNVRACCYNFKHVLGKWPEQRIGEIWRSKEAEQLRQWIREDELGGGCSECGSMIVAGNHHGVRARNSDEYAPNGIGTAIGYLRHRMTGHIGYPKVMEFELSNRCNLECVMCNGYFSSSIRKNREKLPALESPYDDRFVDELEEFLPHLTDAKFLGGEPFMIDVYLKIWERIRKVNPNMRIHITTNGTLLTDRVKELLEGLTAGIILSCDSVNRETYNRIRVNGDFDRVMANLEYFRTYAERKGTFISMAACPITHNWHELPEMLQFCIDRGVSLYLNAVFTPVELSLREQPLEDQERIIAFLKQHPAPKETGRGRSARNLSIRAYNDFIKLLEGWIAERKTLLAEKEAKVARARATLPASVVVPKADNWSEEAVLSTILDLVEMGRTGDFDCEHQKQAELAGMLLAAAEGDLTAALMQYPVAYWHLEDLPGTEDTRAKVAAIAAMMLTSGHAPAVLRQMAAAPPMELATVLLNQSIEDLQQAFAKFTA